MKNSFGQPSAVSNKTPGTPDYALGDVSNVSAILLAVALSSRGGSNGGSRGTTAVVVSTPAVQPIPQGATPQEQARNLAAWLRQHSAGG